MSKSLLAGRCFQYTDHFNATLKQVLHIKLQQIFYSIAKESQVILGINHVIGSFDRTTYFISHNIRSC